jgi:hypothetical protein
MMPSDIREVLRDAAAQPREPFDVDRARTRVRQRRQVRAAAGSAVLVLLVTVGSVTLLPRPDPAGPEPGVTAPSGLAPTAASPGPSGASPSPSGASPSPPGASPSPLALAPPVGWTRFAPPPEVRHHAATRWTGESLLMWGGAVPKENAVPVADGYAFDPTDSRWTLMPASPLSARADPASAWTGREFLVWGGLSNGQPDAALANGAAYNPKQRSWRTLPPAPIGARAPLSVWTGDEFIVWGTALRLDRPPRDGAAYRPATNSWRRIPDAPIDLSDATAVWTGREMIVFGALLSTSNNASATRFAIGAAYNPTTNQWRRLPDSSLSPQASTAAWNGREMVAWDYGTVAAAYDPAANTWRALPSPPIRPAECYPRSLGVAGSVVGEFCGAMVVYDATGRWRDVTEADLARVGLEMAPADGFVFAYGVDELARPQLWAYRPG